MAVDQFGLIGIGAPAPPGAYRGDVQVFEYTGLAQAWQTWNKPRGVSMAWFSVLSGAGGGGAGFTRATGLAGGGGGGGASSNMHRFMIPAIFLPDLLCVQVGNGGLGGVPGVNSGNGGNGVNSFVSFSKTAVLPNIVAYSGVNAPGGGGGGATAAAGAGGTVPTISISQPLQQAGASFNTVGIVGAAGGAVTGANGTAVSNTWSAVPTGPGAGGGGIATTPNFSGGSVAATAVADFGVAGKYNTQIAAAGTGTGAAINGSAGLRQWKPFLQSGGAGGATNDSATAGNGGDGGIGSGGGGGGAGATAGNGGNGGPGLVVIICW